VIAWTNVALPDEHGRLNSVASLGDDITARRAMEHALEQARAERQELIGAILAAESTERARLAEALHDDTIQVMTAAMLAVEQANRCHPSAALTQAGTSLSLAIERARRLMFELCPTLLDEHGLARAVDSLCHQAALDAGFEVSVDISSRRFPTNVEELVYRTVREAVINARRHSQAKHLQVTVADRGDRVVGSVSDDGIGFDPLAVRSQPGAELHLGLPALAQRLRLVKGELRIESRPQAGTTIHFSVPAA